MKPLARAASLDEVLGRDWRLSTTAAPDHALGEARLAAWCRASTNGDWALFQRRLQRDGHDLDVVRRILSGTGGFAAGAEPMWLRDGEWVVRALTQEVESARPSPQPFADLYHALATEAQRILVEHVGHAGFDTFSATAVTDLRTMLIDRVSALLAPALYDRFCSASTGFDDFIAKARAALLQEMFAEKPVLLRVVATITRQWICSTAEFVLRLVADLPDVKQLTGAGDDATVARVTGGFADHHHDGRTVLCVEFDGSRRALYKPKDLGIDAAWAALIDELNVSAPTILSAPRVLPRDGYGWTAFVDHTACADGSEVTAYFRRSGALLALLHCVAAGDVHHENVIAAGGQPIAVDLETLFQSHRPADESAESGSAIGRARNLIAESVVAVGLLPGWGSAARGEPIAVGGMAAHDPRVQTTRWLDVNTDSMRPVRTVAEASVPTNLPHVAGRYATVTEHLDEFCSGFRDYVRFLRDGPTMLSDGRFKGLPVRTVLRPTQFYDLLLNRLRNDTTMADGVVWSAQSDFPARMANWDGDDEDWPALAAERDALLRLSVPRFTTLTDDEVVDDGMGRRFSVTRTTGFDRAGYRMSLLDDASLEWHEQVIRQVCGLTDRQGSGTTPLLSTPASVDAFSEVAEEVADELASAAIRCDGSAAWIGLRWFVDSDVAQLAVLGHDLYNGSAGIATFLAAHARTTGSSRSADLALAAVAGLRGDLHGSNVGHMARLLGVGGATGLGSVVYALTVMAELLSDDDLRADAFSSAELIDEAALASDRQLDVIGGSAGAVLGLLRLHRDTGSDDVLARAVRCGERVLASARLREQVRANTLSSGMSHGAAGFALAMSSLATATGRQDFADLAADLSDEHRGVDEPRGEWRSQWCHGAVGIGLSRLGAMRFGGVSEARVRHDLARATTAAREGWPGHVDTLCCGSLGNIEFLRAAGRALGDTDASEIAAQRLSSVIATAREHGTYRWNGGAQRFNVGLFRGLSGVGYSCLRELDDSIPNLLIWE